MRVGITGATGFIGSALVRRHLELGDSVRCLSRRAQSPGTTIPDLEVVTGDLTRPDQRLVRFAEDLDVLYHCAAEVGDQRKMYAVNVAGTMALLDAASGRIGRWVQLSSAGVYGRYRDGVVSESTPLTPCGLYETSKAAADALVMEAARTGRITSFAILRPTIVFGSGMRNRSIAQMIRVIERRLFFFIGRRGASANYVHVSNVVDALLLCGTSPCAAGRTYNLSDWTTVEEFARAIADALGQPRPRLRLPERPVRAIVKTVGAAVPLPLTEGRIDALVSRARYPADRIRRELHYTSGVSIAAGLAEMVAHEAAR
jgi:nucleoside-diphosphate-sugar epimerase